MRTFVFFRTSAGTYALPLESTLAVRAATGVVELPAPRPDVIGVLPGEPPIVVMSPLGDGSAQIIVVDVEGVSYGLFVEQVTGLGRIADADIRPAPTGQEDELIAGMLDHDDELVLLADPAALARRLS
jgi:chemotaxis signal transduction protein